MGLTGLLRVAKIVNMRELMELRRKVVEHSLVCFLASKQSLK